MLSEWLKNALAEAGMSQAAASKRLTENLGRSIDRAAVNKMVKGTRSIAADEMAVIELMTGFEAPRAMTVPVKGYVGAGGTVEAIDAGDLDEVEAPPNARPGTIAAVVRGSSMFPAYEDGAILYWSETRSPESMANKRCVVQLSDGRILVKVLRRGTEHDLWTLQSLNQSTADIEDVIVEWAAAIDWIKP